MSEAVMVTDRPEKLAYNVGQAAQALGVSKSMIYHQIGVGVLPSRRIFGRVVILAEDVRRVVAEAEPRPARAAS